MSIAALNWAFAQPIMGMAKPVLIALADYADQDGWSWPAIARLGFRAGCDERTAQRAIRQLVGAGLIEVEAGTGRGHVNRYRVICNLSEQPSQANGAAAPQEKGDTTPPITKGDTTPPIVNGAVKGDTEAVKGDILTLKGDTTSPESLRTTNKRTTRRARGRAQPPPRNVYDVIQEQVGVRSLLLPPLPEHNHNAWGRLQ
ncbi:MAG TPA: helix-turn-helix domain-containing protein [Acetobacteraceae bacterium]|jgi:hypothetical protein